MRKIIGLNGLIGSGKDTVANHLVTAHNFVRLSFAAKLKDAVAEMFDLPRDLLEGLTDESRKWREEPLYFWSTELDKEITPRLILQLFGTECMRNGFADNVWVLMVKKQIIDNPDTNFVITDTRMFNEAMMVKELGGLNISVQRGELPLWWNDATMFNRAIWKNGYETGMENPFANSPLYKGPWYNIHSSEWSLAGYDFDSVIDNNGTISELYYGIDKVCS